jgi:hypothetical protein
VSESPRSDLAKRDPALLESPSVDLDTRVKAGAVARRYGVSVRTLDRWITKPHLNFPAPDLVLHDVAGRPCVRLWRLGDLIEWERAQAVRHPQAAVHQSNQKPAKRFGGVMTIRACRNGQRRPDAAYAAHRDASRHLCRQVPPA